MKAATLLCALVLFAGCASFAQAGPLWDYVHRPDPHFKWVETGYNITVPGKDGWVGYMLNLTSQAWLTPEATNRHIWTHQLMVFIPEGVKNYSVGAIYNTGGDNKHPGNPKWDDEDVLMSAVIAAETKTITATLWQVPNQPIVFADDPQHEERSEDAAVAFTWYEFIKNNAEPDIIIFNPMVKSVVKAMDAVQEFAIYKAKHRIEKFMVVGASKRGWTTWLTGGVDDRVIAIAPIVMDMLNFQKNVLHMWQAYGGWTFAFEDYYKQNITKYLDTDKLPPLAAIIDPLMYKANLTMPKLVIDATGDEFFMPDDDHYWWGMLEGETYRLMVANAEHSFATGLLPLITGLGAFYQSILDDSPRPDFTWDIADKTGAITVTSKTEATQAVIRFATSTGDEDGYRRDFRLIKGDTKHDPCHFIKVSVFGEACVNPVIWVGEDLLATKTADGFTYTATQDLPPEGYYRGFFVDMYFPGPVEGMTFRMTTQVSIIPQSFPFAPCSGEGCIGYLV